MKKYEIITEMYHKRAARQGGAFSAYRTITNNP